MALTDEQIEKLEMSIEGTLPESEAQKLDQQFAESPELQQEATEHLDLYYALKAIALKSELQNIHKELAAEGAFDQESDNEENNAKVISLRRPFRISWGWLTAASIFICTFGIGIQNFRHQKNDKLYNQYTSTLSKAYEADPKALSRFTRKSGAFLEYEKFRRGLTMLQRNEPDKAIPLLEAASKSSDRRIQEDAEWFLALAYLKNHERQEAKRQVSKVAGSRGHRFKNQATSLQSAL